MWCEECHYGSELCTLRLTGEVETRIVPTGDKKKTEEVTKLTAICPQCSHIGWTETASPFGHGKSARGLHGGAARKKGAYPQRKKEKE